MKKFVIFAVVFFTPIVLVNILVEAYVRSLPLTIKNRANYFENNKENIEILILGGSQNRDAMNTELMSTPSLNIATSSQGYYINNKFLEFLDPKLPKLKTVIIPITYKHFEMGPPQYNSWRNNTYRYYFDLEIDSKFTYFKDKLLFLSNPKVYDAIIKNYRNQAIKQSEESLYDYNIENSLFHKLEYDYERIMNHNFKVIPQKESPEFLKGHTQYLNKMLDYCHKNDLDVIFSITPVTNQYLQKQNIEIKRNVDSILTKCLERYNARVFSPKLEDFELIEDFRDHTHLGPKGAMKYTEKFETFLKNNEIGATDF